MAKDNAVMMCQWQTSTQTPSKYSDSVTAATNAGITTNNILKSADWSTASVFQKFYYKPTGDTVFGSTVLSTAANH